MINVLVTVKKKDGKTYFMYVFFWIFPRRLIKIAVCRRFGTLYQFHLQRLDVRYEAFEDGTDRVFRNVDILQF